MGASKGIDNPSIWAKIKLGEQFATPWKRLDLRTKLISQGAGVGCGEQALVAKGKPKTSAEDPIYKKLKGWTWRGVASKL